jgi:hypothetical protein
MNSVKESMMGPFEIAAIAIIGGFVVKIMTTWMQTQREGSSAAQKKIQELEHRIHALESGQNVRVLESRVNVLEEIVTTDDFVLQQKFRQLERENAAAGFAPSAEMGRPR